MSDAPKKLKYYVNGQWLDSKTEKWMACFNPSTGEVVALAPQCTQDEVDAAIKAASDAFPAWAATAVTKRAQVLFRMKALVDKNFDELVHLVQLDLEGVLLARAHDEHDDRHEAEVVLGPSRR